MPDATVKFSFVAPNYNGAKVIGACLDAALAEIASAPEPGEIIVVDDASSDDSVKLISSYRDKVTLIEKKSNSGFSSTANAGISAARGDVVFLINNDVQVHPGLAAAALPHFDDPDLFAVSFKAVDETGAVRIGRVLPKFSKGFLKGVPDERVSADEKPSLTFFASGGGAAFCREKLAALGGFDENMDPFYWEDVDLSYRALKRGWKIICDPNCSVFHPSGGIISSNFKKRAADVVSRRNQLVFFWKNITGSRMLLTHALFLFVKILSCVLTLRFDYLKSLSCALARRGAIAQFRRAEKSRAVRTDAEILNLFK